MATIPLILFVAALILAAIDELRAGGRAFTSWAAILIVIALLWGKLG